MQFLVLLFSILFSPLAFSAQQIIGKVERIGTHLFLKTETPDACHKFQLEGNSDEANESLKKLTSGDSLTASGVISKTSCFVTVDSVDYVGLKDLIGYWYNPEGFVRVHDFNSISFYSIDLASLEIFFANGKINSVDYRYSITPSNGKEWVVFLSSAENTHFATITLHKNRASISFYDSENGTIVKTLKLSKWNQRL